MKKILLFLLMFIPLVVNANAINVDDEYTNYDYVIENYDIDIQVEENNIYEVEETVEVKYNILKEEFVRRIPLNNSFERLDGLVLEDKIQIKDLEVSQEYKSTISNGEYIIKVLNDEKNKNYKYIFKYKYNAGKDRRDGLDEFTFNLLGKDWDTVVKNVNFSITMPDSFDSSKIEFLRGDGRYLNVDDIEYKVEKNVITGSSKNVYKASEFLNVRIELDEGYFKNARYYFDNKVFLMVFIPLIVLIIIYRIWLKYGKDEELTLTKSFGVSTYYNSLEFEYLYKGRCSKKGIVSLIIDLANRGFIDIRPVTLKESINNKEDYIIRVNTDYKDCKVNEKLLLRGILDSRKNHVLNKLDDNEVYLSDMVNCSYRVVDKILGNINNIKNHSRIFTPVTKNIVISILLMLISLFIVVGIPILSFTSFSSVLLCMFVILLYVPFFYLLISNNELVGSVRFVLIACLTMHLIIMFSLTPLFEVIVYDSYYMLAFIIGIMLIVGMVICIIYMPKRTEYGIKVLGEIEGIKKCLLNPKDKEIDSVLKLKPNYFYEIWPYSYILGISDDVSRLFKDKVFNYPEWFNSKEEFSFLKFINYLNVMVEDIEEVIGSIE